MVGASNDEHVAYRNEHLQAITKDRILEKCNSYMNTRVEITAASLRNQAIQREEKFLYYLTQQANQTTPAGE